MHNELDVLDGQVNDHASDLGGPGADETLDKVVEDRANLVLVVRILRHDGFDNGVASHQVLLIDTHLSRGDKSWKFALIHDEELLLLLLLVSRSSALNFWSW